MMPPAGTSRASSTIAAPGRRLTKRVSSIRPLASHAPTALYSSARAPDRASRATSPAESVMSMATVTTTTTGGTKRKEREFDGEMAVASVAGEETNINVVVRCRGRNEREIQENSNVVVMTDGVKGKTVELSMGPNALSNKTYAFDRVFSPAADQTMVFDEVVKPMLDEMLAGYNCTIFAYGQTGTGKTYTMSGDMTEALGLLSDSAGIIPRVLQSLFQQLELESSEHYIKCSFIELYNEELRDLITSDDSTKLKIYEDNSRRGHSSTVVQGVEEKFIKDAAQGINLLQAGSMKRQVAATKCNDLSSRSHTVFTITSCVKRINNDGSEDYISAGKLNLVDLAGSENIQRSGAENKRAAEAGLINKSLLTLGRVINALVDRSQHIPYRESKLTRLLQDSLGGRTKTCIIATISPAKVNLEETISTLDYAFRAKNIRNKPQLNAKINRKVLLQELATEIERLKMELIATRQRNGVYLTNETFEEITAASESRRIVMGEQAAKIETLETNLRNKAQELWNLTTTFTGLKRDHEATSLLLTDTKGILEQTEIILTETKRTLEEETILRKAHQETEQKLTCVGSELLDTVKQTVDDVEGLWAKNRRRSDLQAVNRDVWGTAQTEVVKVSELVERRVQEFRDQQEESLTRISGRMKDFVSAEIEQLSTTQELMDQQLELFANSKEELLANSMASRDDMYRMLEGIKDVRDAVKNRVGEGLNEMSGAAQRIAADVLNEMSGLQSQLQASYAGLGSEVTAAFDKMLQHMVAQKAEMDHLRQQLTEATHVVVQQNISVSARVQQVLQAERRQAAVDREKLLTQIAGLITVDSSAREARLAAQTEEIRAGIAQATETLESGQKGWTGAMEEVDGRQTEFIRKVKETQSGLRHQVEDDWTAAKTQTECIQNAAQTVHAEAVRIVATQVADLGTHMSVLDDYVTTARAANTKNYESLVSAIGNVSGTVDKSLDTITTHFSHTFDRVNVLGEAMEADASDAISQLDPIQGNICQPLVDLRQDISSRTIREYEATGSTPKRVQYTFPTSLPRTASPGSLLARGREQQDGLVEAEAEVEIKKEPRDGDGDIVFADAVPPTPTPTSKREAGDAEETESEREAEKERKKDDEGRSSTGTLREVNPNTTSVYEHTVTTMVPLAGEDGGGAERRLTGTQIQMAGSGRLRKPGLRRLTGKKAGLLEGRENQVGMGIVGGKRKSPRLG